MNDQTVVGVVAKHRDCFPFRSYCLCCFGAAVWLDIVAAAGGEKVVAAVGDQALSELSEPIQPAAAAVGVVAAEPRGLAAVSNSASPSDHTAAAVELDIDPAAGVKTAAAALVDHALSDLPEPVGSAAAAGLLVAFVVVYHSGKNAASVVDPVAAGPVAL